MPRYARDAYQHTLLTSLFEKILTTPYPYWIVIFISAIGTFLSIRFGDELMDVAEHKDRKLHHKHGFWHTGIIYIMVFGLVFLGYHHLIVSLGIESNLH